MHPLVNSIAIAQINTVVGDIAGNAARISSARVEAAKLGAKLVVCPELALCGYPPEDLVLRPSFIAACKDEIHMLALATKDGPAIILGAPWEDAGFTYNAALLLAGGTIAHIQYKRKLPNYGIFDEKRVFTYCDHSTPAIFQGVKLGLMICEDVWRDGVARDLKAQGAELLIVINASPFENGKPTQRYDVAARTVQETGLALVYANLVGGQDDVVFDGGSFVMNEQAHIVTHFPQFVECTAITQNTPAISHQQQWWEAAAIGTRDYVHKNGNSCVLLGLSGGIDSAVVAVMAVDALGREHVLGVRLPSPYTSQESMDDASETARLLGIELITVPIAEPMNVYDALLTPVLGQSSNAKKGGTLITSDWMQDPAIGGNIQTRIRAQILMAISNKTGRMLLSTGNKSEIAVGYTTLYGDSCGAYSPIKDLYKTEVYELAAWRNAQGYVIPDHSITRAPSAELKPGQLDQDQLPPYETLDAILALYIEGTKSVEDIIASGFERAVVEKVISLLRIAEYKRRQMPPGPKLSSMLFSREWRYPMTSKFRG